MHYDLFVKNEREEHPRYATLNEDERAREREEHPRYATLNEDERRTRKFPYFFSTSTATLMLALIGVSSLRYAKRGREGHPRYATLNEDE